MPPQTRPKTVAEVANVLTNQTKRGRGRGRGNKNVLNSSSRSIITKKKDADSYETRLKVLEQQFSSVQNEFRNIASDFSRNFCIIENLDIKYSDDNSVLGKKKSLYDAVVDYLNFVLGAENYSVDVIRSCSIFDKKKKHLQVELSSILIDEIFVSLKRIKDDKDKENSYPKVVFERKKTTAQKKYEEVLKEYRARLLDYFYFKNGETTDQMPRVFYANGVIKIDGQPISFEDIKNKYADLDLSKEVGNLYNPFSRFNRK